MISAQLHASALPEHPPQARTDGLKLIFCNRRLPMSLDGVGVETGGAGAGQKPA
jgi:hypothetical protein